MLTLLLVAVAAILVQAVVLCFPGRRLPIGDEIEYIERANAADPFGPVPFLRVPMMAVFVKLAAGVNTERRLRVALAVVAVITVLLVALAGHLADGPRGAIVCGLVFLLLPDRMVLGQHIWPDILLAVWHAALLCLMISPVLPAPATPWLFGLVTAAAVLTRIDAVILLPALTLHPSILHADPFVPAVLSLWLPSIISLAMLTIMHALRYGIPLPDTTLLFNVTVLDAEHRGGPDGHAPVETMIRAVAPPWHTGSHAGRVAAGRAAVSRILGRPGLYLRGFARRAWQMLGPDTFAVECLLDRRRGAYVELDDTVRRALVRVLRISFPLLVAFAVAGVAASSPRFPAYLLPCAAAYLAACLVHARTRFRYALYPTLSFAAARGLLALTDASSRGLAAFVLVAIAIMLLRAPGRTEYAASPPGR